MVRTFLQYCNISKTPTILVMEGIRAGWNKALWSSWQPRNRILLLAGPWWWNWHFWGEESGPLLRQHPFSYDGIAIQKEENQKKKKKQSFADSCHQSLENSAVGIKVRARDYILLQKRNRIGWKVRIAWLADWLEGKDSMIDCLRVR